MNLTINIEYRSAYYLLLCFYDTMIRASNSKKQKRAVSVAVSQPVRSRPHRTAAERCGKPLLLLLLLLSPCSSLIRSRAALCARTPPHSVTQTGNLSTTIRQSTASPHPTLPDPVSLFYYRTRALYWDAL